MKLFLVYYEKKPSLEMLKHTIWDIQSSDQNWETKNETSNEHEYRA